MVIPPDPSIWIDFSNVCDHITEICIYLKPSQFRHSFKITDLSESATDSRASGKVKSEKGAKGKDSKKTIQNGPKVITWYKNLIESRNQPLYIFIDSLDFKYLVISMSQVGCEKFLKEGKIPPCLEKQPSYRVCNVDLCPHNHPHNLQRKKTDFKSCKSSSYFAILNYCWQNNKLGKLVTCISSNGMKTTILDFGPGRKVLQLWIKSDTSYVMNILSDVSIEICTTEYLYDCLCRESVCLTEICNEISSKFGRLIQKFGTSDYKEGIREYFNSYLPKNFALSDGVRDLFHSCFMEHFLRTVQEAFAENDWPLLLFSLKVLFLDPSLKFPIDFKKTNIIKEDDSCVCLCGKKENIFSIEEIKQRNKAASLIIAAFRTFNVKNLLKLHDQSHKQYLKVFETLKGIYTQVFGIQRRILLCNGLLRHFYLLDSNVTKYKHTYKIYKDLQHVVDRKQFKGNISTAPNSWVPITAHIFYINSPHPLTLRIELFTDLKKYLVRVFDNDNKYEIKKHTNNVCVSLYDVNESGYTVLCYGWTENAKIVSWKICFITLRERSQSSIIVSENSINKQVLIDNYIPNPFNLLCKCLIKIRQTSFVTLRLNTCDKNVKIMLKCLTTRGKKICEIVGYDNIILPNVQLEMIKPKIEEKDESVECEDSISNNDFQGIDCELENQSEKEDTPVIIRNSKSGKDQSLNSSYLEMYDPFETLYIIEGYVLNNSWPLTPEEWEIVEIVRNSELVGPPNLNGSQLNIER